MIGVVSSDSEATTTARAILDDLNVSYQIGPVETIIESDPRFFIAIGDTAVRDLVTAGINKPMFPVHIGSSQPPEFTELSTPVVEQLIERNYTIINHPLIEAKTDDIVGRAVFDVLFVTTEPARISEYRIELPHQSTQFRSDGVIITTPLGSYGYAHAAGSPILSLGTNVIGVIPIAPFAIRPDHWIVPSDKPLRFDVLRDEHTVSVLTDGEEITQFSRAFSIEITASQSIEIITIHQENQLEKL